MSKIIKVYRERIPSLRFIGKRYGGFGHWGDWFGNGWFDLLEANMGGADKVRALWADGGDYIGMEVRYDGVLKEYWVGMLSPADTPVPDGFEYMDLAACELGICWIYGRENEVHDTSACRSALEAQGMSVATRADGAVLSFENCTCPRYTTPDSEGNVILDYCYFIK